MHKSQPFPVELRFHLDLSIYPRARALRLLGLVRWLERTGAEDIEVVTGEHDDPDYHYVEDLMEQAQATDEDLLRERDEARLVASTLAAGLAAVGTRVHSRLVRSALSDTLFEYRRVVNSWAPDGD